MKAVVRGARGNKPESSVRKRRSQSNNWRLLFEKYPQPTWVFDQRTLHFLAVSEKAVLHYGYSSQEFLAMTIKDISPADDVPRLMARLATAGESLGSTGVWTHRKKDGSFVDVEIFLERVDFGGRPAWLEVAHDITERQRADRIMREQKKLLQTIFDHIPVMITFYDSSGRIQWANREQMRILGWSLEEMQRMEACPDAESREETLKFVLEAPPEWRDFKLRTQYGHTVDTSWTNIRLPSGSCIGVGKDVTQQKRVEDALRTAEAELRQTMVSISDYLWSAEVDRGGKLTYRYYSPVVEKITGRPPEFFMGGPEKWLSTIHPEDRARLEQAEQRLLNRASVREEEEYRIIRPDGTVRWVRDSVVATWEDSGWIRLDGVASDITDRKAAEEALRKLSGRLLRLQDEERRHLARELHEVTAQSLGALIMNLGRVQQADKVLRTTERRALAESLALAKECSKQIRTFSYLLHPPLLDELGLASALNWLAEGFRSRSGIQVDILLPQDMGRLPQEVEMALFRIVQECFSNILRHSGSPSASVRVFRHSAGVTVEVADRGKGIRGEVLTKVRSNPAMLGVGISGMQERLRQLGGSLEIDSNNSGTTVRAIIPIRTRAQ